MLSTNYGLGSAWCSQLMPPSQLCCDTPLPWRPLEGVQLPHYSDRKTEGPGGWATCLKSPGLPRVYPGLLMLAPHRTTRRG